MKVLVLGGSGLVGSKFIKLNESSFEIHAPEYRELDILDIESIKRFVEKIKPKFILNFAAFTNVEEAEDQKGDKEGLAYKLNAVGVKNLAEAATTNGVNILHISTEYVFDGTKMQGSYKEDDLPNPINWYGSTKYYGEQFLMESDAYYAIVRLSMPYSSHYEQKKDIARIFLEGLKSGQDVMAIKDTLITPTLTDDIAKALKVLMEKGVKGIYHVAAKNKISPFDFAQLLAQKFNFDNSKIIATTFEEYSSLKKAKLLKNSSLDVSKFTTEFGDGILHTVAESLDEFKANA